MKILEYKFSDEIWDFQKICFQDINLIVGDSGSGKTRLLNTIFNFGYNVAQSKLRGVSSWNLVLDVDGEEYRWDVSTTKEDNTLIVERERLFLNDKLLLTPL
jgi:predicted GTPase